MNNQYSCASDDGDAKACRLKLMVRCYGKTSDSPWGVTFESTVFGPEKLGETTFNKEAIIEANKCKNGIHISVEGSLLPKVAKFGFKAVELSLKEL